MRCLASCVHAHGRRTVPIRVLEEPIEDAIWQELQVEETKELLELLPRELPAVVLVQQTKASPQLPCMHIHTQTSGVTCASESNVG